MYKLIIVPLTASKSQQVIDKMKNGDSHKIDQSSDEGKAIIRHLGGWVVHAILAELNQYIILHASSANWVTQNKVSSAISLRSLVYSSLVVSSTYIHENTAFPSSLQHTDLYNRGSLTFISQCDDCYLFLCILNDIWKIPYKGLTC